MLKKMTINQSRSLCKIARELKDEALKDQKEMNKNE